MTEPAELNIKLIVIVTDFKAHPLWVRGDVDKYFVAHQVTRDDLISLGVEPGKIASGFVSLRQGFLVDIPSDFLRDKFGIDNKPCVLFMSSVRGNFPFIKDLIIVRLSLVV